MTVKVAIVYHSGFGHTAVLARSAAQGVRDGGAEPLLLEIEGLTQDFSPFLDEVTAADAVLFGAPTYMGDVSAPFKAFADASAKVWFTGGWADKLAGGFTNSHSYSGDKVHALTTLAILAAQHGMNWVNLGLAPPHVTAAERGPETLNRVGAFLGLMTQSDNADAEITPPKGEHDTARHFGERVAKASRRWAAGAKATEKALEPA